MKQYLKSNKQAPPPEADLRPKQRAPISQVLLVGGGTRMPAVRRFVQNMTGLQPATFVQPDEVGPQDFFRLKTALQGIEHCVL